MTARAPQAHAGRVGNTNTRKRAQDLSTPPWRAWRTRSRSARAIRFIETYCIVPKGHGAGERMKLAKFQKDLLEEILDDDTLRAAVASMPRGNGKSGLSSALALWALHDDEHTPSVPVVATTIQQAIRTIFSTCARMNSVSPELADRTIEYSAVGNTRLYVPWNNGTLMPLPADPDGLQGLDPSLAIVDEVGFVSQELWDAMVLASGKRPRSLVFGIGTPNVERAGAMWDLREKWVSGVAMPGFKYLEHAAPADCDINDRKAWRTGNPAMVAGFLAEDALAMAAATSPEASFRVYRLGQWANAAACWLPVGVWDACTDDVPLVDAVDTWVGVDVGLRRDSTAIVAVQHTADDRLTVSSWIRDPIQGQPVDLADVMAHIRHLCTTYNVLEVAYDPRLFELPARQLLDEGYPMLEFPQSVERMSPACAATYDAIVNGRICHDGDQLLAAHVNGAQQRPNERGWTLSKARSGRHIDACIALVLAVHRAAQPPPPPPAIPSVVWL